MQRLKVAEVTIDMEMTDTDFFNRRYAAYFAPADGEAQMRIATHVVPEIVPPQGETVLELRSTKVVALPDGRRCHYQYSRKHEQYYQMCCYTPDFSDVDISLNIPDESTDIPFAEFEHAYSGFDFANRIGYLGGAVLHGSAIAYKGRGVIFSAPSGTGKSTHTALWKQCFGEDVVHINDDKPALRFRDDGVVMYGTPWSGKTDLNTNQCVPLHAVVFVERGEENSLRRMDATESMLHLQSQVVQPYHDAHIGSVLIDRMITVAETVPVYLMTCNMDPEAALTARRVLFDE